LGLLAQIHALCCLPSFAVCSREDLTPTEKRNRSIEVPKYKLSKGSKQIGRKRKVERGKRRKEVKSGRIRRWRKEVVLQ
jgi:hypothetical protein